MHLRVAHVCRRGVLVGVLLAALCLAACGSSHAGAPASASATTAPSASTTRVPTVWLCRPGLANDPCLWPEGATALAANGAASRLSGGPAVNPRFDCFYVYPTVSTEPGSNADLTVQAAEINAAVEQASRFSAVCNVWAPMYRQRTLASLLPAGETGIARDPQADQVAFESLRAAFEDYLAHDNHGRPIVFIGHSQGAAMLIRLLQSDVDSRPAVRKLLVSAIIVGGNVQVPVGHDTGGSFQHIPACRAASQTGCVIAYSSFLTPPAANSLFGRPGQGVSLQSGQATSAGQEVLCTNPANLGGGSGALEPFFTVAGNRVAGVSITTPWVTFPGLYTAQCEQSGDASWLQVTPAPAAGDIRPRLTQTQDGVWGLHSADINLALGNLVGDVRAEEQAYRD